MVFVSENLDDHPTELKPCYYTHYFTFADVLKFMLQRNFSWHVSPAENLVVAKLL